MNIFDKLDLYLKKNDKIKENPDNPCCDNEEIEETIGYSVCRNCGLITSLNPLIDNQFKLTSELINEIYSKRNMKTYISYSHPSNKGFNNYIRYLNQSGGGFDTILHKQNKLYEYSLDIEGICGVYNIPLKYADYTLYEYKRFYVDNNMVFGKNTRWCMYWFLLNQILQHFNKKKIPIFTFLKDFKISYKTYNRLHDKIGLKYLKIYNGMTEFYEKIKYKYSIPISLEYFMFYCNKIEKYLKLKYTHTAPKTIFSIALLNLLELYNLPYKVGDIWKLSSKRIYYEYFYRFGISECLREELD